MSVFVGVSELPASFSSLGSRGEKKDRNPGTQRTVISLLLRSFVGLLSPLRLRVSYVRFTCECPRLQSYLGVCLLRLPRSGILHLSEESKQFGYFSNDQATDKAEGHI